MIHDPDLLILDEPTAGLDPVQINETLTSIKELGTKHTVLLSTHILAEVEKICERVIIINAGRIGLDRRMADLSRDATVTLLEVRAPAESVTRVLQGIEGVAEVKAHSVGDDVSAFEIRTHFDRDVRETIAQQVAKNGWPLRLLDLRKGRLEDHFVNVVVRGQERMSA
jgi:ABC-2 type transport system ATP-binding protein